MNIEYRDGRSEEFRALMDRQVIANLERAMADPQFKKASIFKAGDPDAPTDGLTATERMERKKDARKKGVMSNKNRGRK